MSEDSDQVFLETMRDFPAVFDKSHKDHSNRDIVSNGWISIAKIMRITEVEEAKEWWNRLLREYRAEKNKRDMETRSGSGASIKRECFPYYEVMRDMLMTSHSTGTRYTNYPASSSQGMVEDSQNEQLEHVSSDAKGGYNYKTASGRSGKKALAINRTVNKIDAVLEMGHALLKDKTQHAPPVNPNNIIGSLVQSELETLEMKESAAKRKKIHAFLNEYENRNDLFEDE